MQNHLIKPRMGMTFEMLALFTAQCLPLIFLMLWLLQNTQLPISDATDYELTAINIYRQIHEHGLWYSLMHLERGFRPIFFPVLSVPFLLLSKENLFVAFDSMAFLCVIMSATYVFLLLRIQLDKWQAVLATNMVLLSPLFLNPILTFFAESALFPALMAAIYHLHQSNYFSKKGHRFGFTIAFALAILVRPLEAFAQMFFVICIFLGAGYKNKHFTRKQISQLIAIALSTVFLSCVLVAMHFLDHYPFAPIDGGAFDAKFVQFIYHILKATLGLSLLAWLVFFLYRPDIASKKRSLLRPFLGIIFLVALWYVPEISPLYVWIFRTSFGDLAVNTPQMSLSLQQFFINWMNTFGIISCVIFGLALLFSLFRVKLSQLFSSTLPWYLLALLPFPMWEIFFTVQNTPRKLSVAIPTFLMLSAFLLLRRGRWHVFCSGLFACLLMLQFSVAILSFFMPLKSLWLQMSGSYERPVRLVPNPHDVILQFLAKQNKIYPASKITILTKVESALPVDIFLLRVLAVTAHQPFQIYYPYFTQYATKNIYQISRQMDAVFLSDAARDMTISPQAAKEYREKMEHEVNINHKLFYEMLTYYAEGKLTTIGLTLGPCTQVIVQNDQPYKGCLLLSNHRSEFKNTKE